MTTPLIRTHILSLTRSLDSALPVPGHGIESLRLLPDGKRLEVRYDRGLMTLTQVAERLLARWGRALTAFKDENRRDQSEIVHQCCSIPPKHD